MSLPGRGLNRGSQLHFQVSLASVEIIKIEGRTGIEARIQLFGRGAAGQVAWPLSRWRPGNVGHLTYFFDFHCAVFLVLFFLSGRKLYYYVSI